MAECFNPVVRTLRLHWFSARPCFQLLDPAAGAPFARKFMCEEQYYREDQAHPPLFDLRRLGRRFQEERHVGKDAFSQQVYRPHGFWSIYMSRVAHPDYQGVWKGLAPMRFLFRGKPSAPLVRIRPEFAESLKPQVQHLRAYPTCYLFPIGWAVGIVVQAEGEVALANVPGVVDRLRREPAFLGRGGIPLPLDRLLRGLHEVIREEFLGPRTSSTLEQDGNPYLVASPLKFDDQGSFQGQTLLDADGITAMLAGGPLANEKKLLITPGNGSIAMTALNRGTFVMASLPELEPRVPGCSSSNMKNALLITTLMQKFHQISLGHTSVEVAKMRGNIVDTFEKLENCWNKPHFQKVCDAHTGIRKMRVKEKSSDDGTGTSLN
jgi:hypothetical protein